jgi:hypothetical protein
MMLSIFGRRFNFFLNRGFFFYGGFSLFFTLFFLFFFFR